MRVRLPKEAKNSAAISPCERVLPETHSCSSELDRTSTTDELISAKGVEESTGELMQCTRNGVLRWKHVKVYINKKSQVKHRILIEANKVICWLNSRVEFCSVSLLQVIVEIKSKHVVGAFSMKSKG